MYDFLCPLAKGLLHTKWRLLLAASTRKSPFKINNSPTIGFTGNIVSELLRQLRFVATTIRSNFLLLRYLQCMLQSHNEMWVIPLAVVPTCHWTTLNAQERAIIRCHFHYPFRDYSDWHEISLKLQLKSPSLKVRLTLNFKWGSPLFLTVHMHSRDFSARALCIKGKWLYLKNSTGLLKKGYTYFSVVHQ